MNNKDIRNYRRTRMQKELIIEKLREKGCRITKQRLMLLDIILEEKGAFPHEIGLLLGYPVEDVLGFIRHQGKNYLYTGYTL